MRSGISAYPRPLPTASPPNLERILSIARSAAARLSLTGSIRLAGSASAAGARLESPTPRRRKRVPSASRFSAVWAVRKMRSANWVGASSEALRVQQPEIGGLEFQHHGAAGQAHSSWRGPDTRSACRHSTASRSASRDRSLLKVVSEEMVFISPPGSTARLSWAWAMRASQRPVAP